VCRAGVLFCTATVNVDARPGGAAARRIGSA
jgi:hypothetical protein